MKAKKKPAKKPTLPIQIPLTERVLLENGTMFVTLRTLDELEQFWKEHQGQFEFSCEGIGITSGNSYLREYEWVFGTSKSAVVQTAMRWDAFGFGCEFFEWAKRDPLEHASFFRERDEYRESQIKNGQWSETEETEHQADCVRRTPETYRGYWKLTNLPGGCDYSDWLRDSEELFDPNMPVADVARIMQEQTFDEWNSSGCEEIRFYDRVGVEETITYWLDERAQGEDYYGRENELATTQPQ